MFLVPFEEELWFALAGAAALSLHVEGHPLQWEGQEMDRIGKRVACTEEGWSGGVLAERGVEGSGEGVGRSGEGAERRVS